MNNAEKFQKTFGIYATEMWAMPENEFLEWLNSKHSEKAPSTDEHRVYIPSRGCGKSIAIGAYKLGWEDGREALRREIWEDGRDRLD